MTQGQSSNPDLKSSMKPQMQFENRRALQHPTVRGFRSAIPEGRATRFAAYLFLVRRQRYSILFIGIGSQTKARTGVPMSLLRFSVYETWNLFIYVAYHEVLGMAIMRLGDHNTGSILLITKYCFEALGLAFLIKATFSHFRSNRKKRRSESRLLSLLRFAITYLEQGTPKPRKRDVPSRARELKPSSCSPAGRLSASSPRSIRKRESS